MKTQYGFTRFDTLEEFKTWIAKQPKYKYTGLQVHHTALPDYSCFYKANGKTEDELTSWALLGQALLGIVNNPVSVVAVITAFLGIWNDNSTKGLDKFKK